MGFVLSVIYFVTDYLTPGTIFGPLAAYRIELILAVLAMLVSLPKLAESFILKTQQLVALIALAFATLFSVVIGMHWFGGALPAVLTFIPNAFAYILVCLHCNSKRRLQVLVLMMLFVCLFAIAQGSIELRHGPAASDAQGDESDEAQIADADTPYLYVSRNDTGEWIYRLRGLGEINDPNDFGQLIVCVLPLVFIFWSPKKTLKNITFVLLPVCVLLFGLYLTHSRGAILALLAMVIVAARRRIGTLPALLIAIGLFAGATALNFTGGREISAKAGEDRTALWGEGMELLKSHPLFGVGFGDMGDYAGQTAHNSVVVCAAELGLFGLYFWAVFLFSTMRDVLVIASPDKVTEGELVVPQVTMFPKARMQIEREALDKAEVCRLGRLILLSLTGFLVAGWFLSRAFVMTFFLLGGMVEAVFEMALRRGMISPRLPLRRVLLHAGTLTVVMLLFMYIMLRVTNLMH